MSIWPRSMPIDFNDCRCRYARRQDDERLWLSFLHDPSIREAGGGHKHGKRLPTDTILRLPSADCPILGHNGDGGWRAIPCFNCSPRRYEEMMNGNA